MGRENQEPYNRWQAEERVRDAFATRLCLAPAEHGRDCTRKICKAHTVPKSGSLERIARNGHVYSFVPTFEKLDSHRGLIPPSLVGINRASTFTGFCSFHDNELFAPIEKRPFQRELEQCFLLGYRAVARETFTKRAAASIVNSDEFTGADRGRSLLAQIAIQQHVQLSKVGTEAGLQHIDSHKRRYDEVVTSSNYDQVRAYVIEIDGPPPVMCSGGKAPEYDFEGNSLQDLANLSGNYDLLNCSSFYGGEYGAIVFTWLSDSDKYCLRFMRSLCAIDDVQELTDALVRFLFESFENVHMSPEWWEGLPDATKRTVMMRAIPDITLRKDKLLGPDRLMPDGIHFAQWPIRSKGALNFTA